MKKEIEETGEARPDHYSQKEGAIECIQAIEQLCEEHQNDPFTTITDINALSIFGVLVEKMIYYTNFISQGSFLTLQLKN